MIFIRGKFFKGKIGILKYGITLLAIGMPLSFIIVIDYPHKQCVCYLHKWKDSILVATNFFYEKKIIVSVKYAFNLKVKHNFTCGWNPTYI